MDSDPSVVGGSLKRGMVHVELASASVKKGVANLNLAISVKVRAPGIGVV